MKNLMAIFILLFLFSSYTFASVEEDDLSRIYVLINEKKYEEALEAHKKYFKDSKGTSAAGVRLSFGLSSWAELGKVYPPAHMALLQMAAERKDLIYSGKAEFDDFQEYESINSYINRQGDTIETFFYLEKHFPQQAQRLFPLVEDLFVAKKQYEVIKKYAGDPIYEFENLRNRREYSLSQLRNKSMGYSLTQINTEFNEKYQTLLETTEQIGLLEEADELKRRYDGYMKGNVLRKYH